MGDMHTRLTQAFSGLMGPHEAHHAATLAVDLIAAPTDAMLTSCIDALPVRAVTAEQMAIALRAMVSAGERVRS